MSKLLIGTTNPAKLKDYKKLLSKYNFELVGLKDFDILSPDETGSTFEENAVLKAKYYFNKSGIPTIADDGGFEIDFLNGEPGVKSHRWLGHEMSDSEIIAEVLKRMSDAPDDKRSCRIRGVIAVASSLGVMTTTANIEGLVAKKASKTLIKGFPYRSVMYLPNYKKYFGELNEAELEIMNHRKVAIEKIDDYFKELSK